MLRLYDTRTRATEEVAPSPDGVLRVYACGPTVYRYAHVGNLRTFLLHDLVRRVVELDGTPVHLVQNITDVGHLQDDSAVDADGEDKLLAQARLEKKDPFALARWYEDAFHRDSARLGVRPADDYPRASEWIDEMLRLVDVLVQRDHAYVGGDGTVYFDSRSVASYGEISGNRLEDLRPGHRMDHHTGSEKRFHADWALWKAAGPGREMTWDSPWGRGFPGWHLECSAMSLRLLGERIDLHTGGIDLRFPHHEDERAQSDAAVGHEVVRRWVHGEHLLFEGRKMSKSAGNVVLLSDLDERGLDPLALRLAFLRSRYRVQMNLTWDVLEASDRTIARWRRKVADWATAPSAAMDEGYRRRLLDALHDDLDTTTALVALGELERDDAVAPGSRFETFAHLDRVLGLDLVRDVGRPVEEAPLPDGAAQRLDARAAARAEKDFATSDRLREELAGLGVAVVDTKGGQTWTVA